MQLANEQIALELLSLSKSASAQDIRDAYIKLCRVWHPKAMQKWKEWDIVPNEVFANKIYNSIKTAFEILSRQGSQDKSIVPLDEALLNYKTNCEIQLAEKARPPSEEVDLKNVLEITKWPSDLVYLAASFFDYNTLSNFAITSRRNYQIAKLLFGLVYIRDGKYKKFLRFLENNPNFWIRDLRMEFGVCEEPSGEALNEFFSVNRILDSYCKGGTESSLQNLQSARTQYPKAEDFFAYLKNNMRALFRLPKLITEIFTGKNPKNQMVFRFLLGKISVFELITSLPFNTVLFDFLTRSIKAEATLPSLRRTRENFVSTAKYFEYLICNIHDLYVALCLDSNLINTQDENGQTLLFHPSQWSLFFSSSHLQWLAAIFSHMSNVNLEVVDNELQNTFLHCLSSSPAMGARLKGLDRNDRDPFMIARSNFLKNFVMPMVELALKRHFNFQRLNKNGESLLHVAAEISDDDGSFVKMLVDLRQRGIASGVAADILPDPNQCAENSGHTPFARAIEKNRVLNAEFLLTVTNFNELSLKNHLLHIQCLIFTQFRKLIKIEIPREEANGTIDYYLVMTTVRQSFVAFRMLQRLFVNLLAKLDKKNIYQDSQDVAWLHRAMVSKLIKEISGNNALATLLRREEMSLETKEHALFKHLGSHPESSISIATRKIFEDELKNILKYVYSYSHLIVKNFSPIASIGFLRALLAAQLVSTTNLATNNRTKELAKYFNEITDDLAMKDCEELFNFLLLYRDNIINSRTIWLTPSRNVINWQQMIQMIRDSALEKVKSSSAAMGYPQAIEYLTACREYLIFSLPNTFSDSLGFRTYAVTVIDDLKEQRTREMQEAERKKQPSF